LFVKGWQTSSSSLVALSRPICLVAASADPAAAQAVAALGLAAVAAFLLICRVLTLLIHVVLLVVLLLHNSSPSVEVNNKRLLAVVQA
jgi:hypothetical protein